MDWCLPAVSWSMALGESFKFCDTQAVNCKTEMQVQFLSTSEGGHKNGVEQGMEMLHELFQKEKTVLRGGLIVPDVTCRSRKQGQRKGSDSRGSWGSLGRSVENRIKGEGDSRREWAEGE